MMKNSKYLSIIFIVAIVIGVFYLLVKNTKHLTKTTEKASIITNQKPKKTSNLSKKDIILTTEQIFKSKATSKLTFSSRRGRSYFNDCGLSLDDEKSHVYKALQKDDLTEKQLQSLDKMIDQCKKWYDFYISLSFDELKKFHQGIEDAQTLNGYFDNPPEGIDRKTLKKDARAALANYGDETLFTYSALSYLFKYDYKFLKRIADELNIKSINYVKQNSGHVIILYQCSIKYEAECSANSMTMMQLCIEDESRCGMSFDQVIASWVTPNNYADLLQIVDIIRNLVRQGFFDDALEDIP